MSALCKRRQYCKTYFRRKNKKTKIIITKDCIERTNKSLTINYCIDNKFQTMMDKDEKEKLMLNVTIIVYCNYVIIVVVRVLCM